MTPLNTYRVQLTPSFGFADAAAIVPYLAELGVTHLYCSPWLQAAPGSQHGYDVVDHTRVNDELGGPEAHAALIEAVHTAGLGIVLDIVPNHMAVSEPESQNAHWWGLLRDGREGPDAAWFDVDWEHGEDKVLVPVLGGPLAEHRDELKREGDRIHYYDHVVPDSEHLRLSDWRVASEDLNYRRFFDVTTLAGIRVEDPAVFDASHALILEQVASGQVQGLRVDHPDGLADPEGYLARLAQASGGVWTAVEKILEPGEPLPASWKTAGTTGYDALNQVTQLFADSGAETALTQLYAELTGELAGFADVVDAGKRLIVDKVLGAEVNRLTRGVIAALPTDADVTVRGAREAIIELLVAFDVYRAYLTPGHEPTQESSTRLAEAQDRARSARPDLAREIGIVGDLVRSGPAELVTRFQQTCGPVMAKGIEDTAFYRYHRFTALNEVGGDPGRIGLSQAEFHSWCTAIQTAWPTSMTTLSTHDTKRSEDTRARLLQLSHDVDAWAVTARTATARLGELAPAVDANTRYLFLQTLVGVWPAETARLSGYLEKATREAKRETSWTSPDTDYDEAVQAMVTETVADEAFLAGVTEWIRGHEAAAQLTGRAAKLVQLTMPGVADCYQGTETVSLALVDPDNRRPVDYDALRVSLGEGSDPKQRVVATALRLRREHPELFGEQATYTPVEAGPDALAFLRSDRVLTVVPVRQGSQQQSLTLPEGRWQDLLTERWHEGDVTVAGLLGGELGVALLVRG